MGRFGSTESFGKRECDTLRLSGIENVKAIFKSKLFREKKAIRNTTVHLSNVKMKRTKSFFNTGLPTRGKETIQRIKPLLFTILLFF